MKREGEIREQKTKWKGKTILKNKKNEDVLKSSQKVQFKNNFIVAL